MPPLQDIFRIRSPEGDAKVVQFLLYLSMEIACQRHFEVRLHRPDDIQSRTHGVKRPFVHGYHCLSEPALVSEMICEIRDERCPVGLVSSTARGGLHIFRLASRPVDIIELQRPRYHGIAVYLPVDTDFLHEFDPAVKYSIII